MIAEFEGYKKRDCSIEIHQRKEESECLGLEITIAVAFQVDNFACKFLTLGTYSCLQLVVVLLHCIQWPEGVITRLNLFAVSVKGEVCFQLTSNHVEHWQRVLVKNTAGGSFRRIVDA